MIIIQEIRSGFIACDLPPELCHAKFIHKQTKLLERKLRWTRNLDFTNSIFKSWQTIQ